MFKSESLNRLLDEVDLLVAEVRELRARGPHIRIVHRFVAAGYKCAPGEEVFAVCLVHRGREYNLRLSLALRILFDYLARHSHIPQSAAQIEAGIRADRFYSEHAKNTGGKVKLTKGISRSYVRVYVERLREALGDVLERTHSIDDPRRILVSESTVMNEVGYRLRARTEWFHVR